MQHNLDSARSGLAKMALGLGTVAPAGFSFAAWWAVWGDVYFFNTDPGTWAARRYTPARTGQDSRAGHARLLRPALRHAGRAGRLPNRGGYTLHARAGAPGDELRRGLLYSLP